MGAEFQEAFSRFQAARRGGLASYDLQRQQANLLPLKGLEAQAGLAQDPGVRQSILQNPALAKILGLTPQTMEPYVNAPTATAGTAASPLRGPSDVLAGTRRGLPPPVATNDSVDRFLKLAQGNRMNVEANRILGLGQGGMGAGAPEGFVELGRTVDPITGGLKVKYGPPPVRTVTSDTLDPRDAKPYRPGKGPAGEYVDVKRAPGAGKLGESIQRAKSGRIGLQRLLEPRGESGKRPVDIVPDFSGPGILNTLNRSVTGSIDVPLTGKNVGTAYLQNIARDKQNPDSQSAQEILAAAGAITNLVKGFGDAANVAVPEEARLQEAFIPGYGDSPGVGGSAETKVKIAMAMLDDIVAAAEKNPNLTAGEVAAIMGKGFAAAGLDAPTPKEGFDPSAVVGGKITTAAGDATGTNPAAGRGTGPTSDIEKSLLRKYGPGAGAP